MTQNPLAKIEVLNYITHVPRCTVKFSSSVTIFSIAYIWQVMAVR